MLLHVEDVFFKGPKPLCRALLPSEQVSSRIVKLEMGTCHVYQCEVLNIKEENSALVHYVQVYSCHILTMHC